MAGGIIFVRRDTVRGLTRSDRRARSSGRGPLTELATELNEMNRLVDVHAGDPNRVRY
jgi:hypothetical protein